MTPEEIIAIRQSLGITQNKFAQLLEASPITVNRWENGHTVPSRLYIKELKELRSKSGSYVCRREETKDA